MDEELLRMLGLQNEIPVKKDEYIPGSEAPQILPPPEQEPEESPQPEQKPKPKPKPKRKNPSYAFSSALTVVGIVVVAACAFFLLSREVAIQEQRDAISQISTSIESLYAERDTLITEYNSALNMIDIRTRAEQIGMHAPVEGQIVELGGN